MRKKTSWWQRLTSRNMCYVCGADISAYITICADCAYQAYGNKAEHNLSDEFFKNADTNQRR